MQRSVPQDSSSPSPSPLDSLLADYKSVSSSIDASSLVLGKLNRQLADCYMDTLTKRTALDKQMITLQSIELQDKVDRLKMKGDRSRSTLLQLRKEYEEMLQEVSGLQSSSCMDKHSEHISLRSLNTWYTIALFVLPLIATFLVSRMILASNR